MEKIIEVLKNNGTEYTIGEGANGKQVLHVGNIHKEFCEELNCTFTASTYRILRNNSKFDVIFADNHKETMGLANVINLVSNI